MKGNAVQRVPSNIVNHERELEKRPVVMCEQIARMANMQIWSCVNLNETVTRFRRRARREDGNDWMDVCTECRRCVEGDWVCENSLEETGGCSMQKGSIEHVNGDLVEDERAKVCAWCLFVKLCECVR